MRSLLFIICIVLVLSENTCSTGQFYIKQLRQTQNFGSEESHVILDGSSTLYTSPALENYALRTLETCVSETSSHSYTIKLKDSYGDSWTAGSTLTIKNDYGGVIFVGYLVTPSDETFSGILFYTPILKGQSWKFKNSVSESNWNTVGYSDGAWTSVTLPNPSTTTSGTQYFRHVFTGHSSAAAYEVGLKYRYGIIAHINGVEAYRENMPDGVADMNTYASASYSSSSYRGFIRNAVSIQSSSQAVLAVEMHFLSAAPQTSIDFDAWLAIYGNSARDSNLKCHVIGVEAASVVASSAAISPTLAYNLGKADYFSQSSVSTSSPLWLSIIYSGLMFQFNGFEIWPSTQNSFQPHTFSISASTSDQSSGVFTTLAQAANVPFTSQVFKYGVFPFSVNNTRQFKITATQGWSSTIYLYEFHPMVCGVSVPTSISFTPTTSRYYKSLEAVSIEPNIFGLSSCSVSPNLPSGLSLNSVTCVISGVATETKSMTSYTITAANPSISGQISFEIVNCAETNSPVQVYRSYGISSSSETFKIMNEAGTSTLFEEGQSSYQTDGTQTTRAFCLSGTRFQLVLGSTAMTYWNYPSHMQIHNILDDEKEIVLHHRYDTNIGLNPTVKFSMYRPIAAVATWKYKFGYNDNTWYSADTSTWSGSTKGSFGSATNKYQVFRNTFTVSTDELAKSGNVVISVKYQYGIMIYLNDIEVYRNNLGDGPLSEVNTNSFYSSAIYRQVSLPVKTMKIGETAAQQYVKSGTNNIGIALVAQTASQTTVVFDACVRLGSDEEDRSFDATIDYLGSFTNPQQIFSKFYNYYVSSSACQTNYIQTAFANDRREWISSVVVIGYYSDFSDNVKSLKIQARNPSDGSWITISEQSNWKWWTLGQHKKFYLSNNKAYNAWRFTDMSSGDTTQCSWKMSAGLLMSSKTDVAMETLTYPASYSAYRDIEMAELFPSTGAMYRSNFRVSPVLPTGISIDQPSGVLVGTPIQLSNSATYTISADSVSGDVATATISLEVVNCENGKSLITTVIRTDSSAAGTSYKTVEGRTATSGTIISQRSSLPSSNSNFWIDLCLPHKFYTFQIKATSSQGMLFPAGVWMNVDHELIMFAMDVMNTVSPLERNIVFTSQLPFEVEFTDWKLYRKSEGMSNDWMKITFDDSTWETKRADVIRTSPVTTMYYRAHITIEASHVEHLQVISGHCKYTGGIIGYFNANRVVRFNLPEKIGQYDSASNSHPSDKYSKFSFPVQLKGIVAGKNIMAFEHHRYSGHSTSSEHVFDCTGVFGAEDVNIMGLGFENFEGSPAATSFSYSNMVDGRLDMYTGVPNVNTLAITWNTLNLERNQFNAYILINQHSFTGYSWTIHARFTDSVKEQYENANHQTNAAFVERQKMVFDCPVCMAGYRFYKFTLDNTGTSTLYIQEFAYAYKKVSGSGVCAQSGDYPSVGNGQISPSLCPDKYRGYSYRLCTNGVFGDVMVENCKHKPPENLAYARDVYELVIDTDILIPEPTYDNIITSFKVDGISLPEGLVLNTATGAISGRVTKTLEQKMYTIFGDNDEGTVRCEIKISSRVGRCAKTVEFPQTEVGYTGTYDCSQKSGYFGKLQSKCVLGAVDGTWDTKTGSCTPVSIVVAIVLLVVIIVVVVVFVVLRSKKRAGRGKKGASSKKGSSAQNKIKSKASQKV